MRMTRREILATLGALGFGLACSPAPARDPQTEPEPWGGGGPVGNEDGPARQNIEALMDLFIPKERDDAGNVVSPGALEAGAYEVAKLENMIEPARALGLIRNLPEGFDTGLQNFDESFRAALSGSLDALASDEVALSFFRQLDEQQKTRAVRRGFEDPAVAPLLTYVRAACFIAYLGAVENDLGLQAVGFPPFEDFADRRAVSGYPRTVSDGRLINPATENLTALANAGELDDYTVNQAPAPTPGDDLSSVLDANGDLY